ncbi:MAG: hypothetical protein M1828_005912 [Chrysothrix sp. TS-e1954]|nr:MAG: hypothetical protein M1828_005912 [Chrysothrix sp. TS-e1954]
MDVAAMLNGDRDPEARDASMEKEVIQSMGVMASQTDGANDDNGLASVYTSKELPYSSPASGSQLLPHDTVTTSRMLDDGHHSETEPPKDNPKIKSEAGETSAIVTTEDQDSAPLDDATLAAIIQAQSEHGTRVRRPVKTVEDAPTAPSTSPPLPAPQPASSKKLPSMGKAIPKGIKKPSAKKRKLDQTSTDDASSKRSGTPASRMSKAPAAKGINNTSQSVTPRSSSPFVNPASDDGAASVADSDMDDTPYCICRKPDNHTWMIGCEGGCDDWFHGKCVNLDQADEGLIDHFICPNCVTTSGKVTTWKPMCRNGGCRTPARVRDKPPSKYCSDDCGIEFFTKKLNLASRDSETSRTQPRGFRPVEEDGQFPGLGSRGGAIRPEELRSLLGAVSDVQEFRRLGSVELLTPPASAPPETEEVKDEQQDTERKPPLSTHDETRLQQIANRKEALRERRALLKDRERFVTMTKERAAKAVIKTKVKDQCGFDDRLSWDDKTFAIWRRSQEGEACFMRGSLDDGNEKLEQSDEASHEEVHNDENATLKPPPPPAAKRDDVEGYHMCLKRRCSRHTGWQKLALQDVRFEEADVGDEMRRIDREEKDIQRSAAIKARIQSGGGHDSEHGAVEIIDGV